MCVFIIGAARFSSSGIAGQKRNQAGFLLMPADGFENIQPVWDFFDCGPS